MIYEFRTYDLFPHNLPKYQEILTNSLAGGRLDHSDLFGYFYSEFGPSTGHSTFGHTKAWTNASPFATKPTGITGWPPPTGDLLADQSAEIYFPAPFNDSSITGARGPFYELRTYTYRTGEIPKVIDRWGKAIDERRKLSPFMVAGTQNLAI
ncbi:MAG: NIPSNAP family protein [Dehalococcoidia bacterium]|nr:NIPSNAP family protein [Dehalococcoidia bacterium]|tara:strand:+ start:378 stop:833 length:456 start_codon:yes stop_codon:yes gene_type:complete